MARNWFVLRVQTGKEDVAKEALERRARASGLALEEVEPGDDDASQEPPAKSGASIGRVLVPTERISEIRSGEKKVRERKIYPNYIMVEVDTSEDGAIPEGAWFLIRETPGVGDFLGTANRPTPMTKKDVDKVLGDAERKDEAPKIRIGFTAGESVRIKEGPFENFDGVVEEVSPGKGLVKVVVTIFGRPTPVELEYWQVERI